MQNGKGDKARPLVVSRKEFNDNWELAFGDKKKKPKEQEKPDDKSEDG